MAISPGTKLGPYEISSTLGAGGMGEVYRARDTRLERTVAIKVLPWHLSSNPELKARFEREARAISLLSHPHICHLYDIGSQDGIDYLVMELLEGESLDRRLEKGPLPLKQSLEYGMEIAEALEKAHKNGIVHRDLKPGNVMLTKSGAKLLDFGLAKPAPDLAIASQSTPTISKPLTGEGTIIGTYQYMAPEQIQGVEADARTDIFAFGAVLYEMVTGKRAFVGKSQISVMSAILEKEPEPISAIQPMAPTSLDQVVRTCLEKNPEDRFESAHDLRLQLKRIAETRGERTRVPERRKSQWFGWAAAGALLIVAAVFAYSFWRANDSPQPVVKSRLLPPEQHTFGAPGLGGGHMTFSPDGRAIAFVASHNNAQQLWVQQLGSLSPQALAGTEEASYPFWSPDSHYIGFFAGGKMKRIAATGGPVQTICDAGGGRGGSWNEAGTIIFAMLPNSVLFAVSAAGGTPRELTKFDGKLLEISHRWPWFLPDGLHYLFTTRSYSNNNAVFAGSLDSAERKLIVAANSNAAYVSPGYLLYVRDGTLMVQRFDAKRLEVKGEPSPVAEKVDYDPSYSKGDYSASENGVLAYKEGNSTGVSQIVWFNRSGKKTGEATPIGNYGSASLSPDDKTLAFVQVDTGRVTIWLENLARNVSTRFAFNSPFNFAPVWSPDGKQVAFVTGGQASPQVEIDVKPADGSKPEQPLLDKGQVGRLPLAWSADGRFLLFRDLSSGLPEIWALPLTGERKPFPVIQIPSHHATWAAFSPDGKWITYDSDESGRPEVYVKTFLGQGGRWQASTDGGIQPVWRGNEIFFFNAYKVWAAEVHAKGNSLQLGRVHELFSAGATSMYGARLFDVTRDGKRFVINMGTTVENPSPITLVSNWMTELKK